MQCKNNVPYSHIVAFLKQKITSFTTPTAEKTENGSTVTKSERRTVSDNQQLKIAENDKQPLQV